MPSQPNHLEEILCRGHCSSIVEVRLLRFWEARTFKRGGELMGWICFSLCQGFPIFDNFTFSFLILSDSATTSTKDYRDSNISGREAMQRSDDITINSTASVKRRGSIHWTFHYLFDYSLGKLHEELFSPEPTGPGSDHRSSPATRCLGAPSTEPTHRIIEGPPLERNLELTDYPHLPRIPLREEVMEDLREVTFQYTNVTDPIEAAARFQRVISSEEEGLMEETASRIIAAAANNLRQCEDRDRALPEEETKVQSTPMARAGTGRTLNHTPRSTRNARERSGASRRTQASPRIFAGTNLRRRNIA
ncbi:unnamed protein product [Brassica napus]|uniref:(rape) hypothetical protein n=1 Tax=Brassica napus TaxID=3708 RepID=A0A816RLG0_BRANA|nr:unnamed protein product [Brassica napus]